ncbi:MAG: N-acetyltransferase [Ruminiclostridium sp.]|nr:N-acetyltransferase [Ruminococcus sp.]MBP3856619.1 N-acetyltransferase [Ruminiclostridium sp.]
MNETMTVNGKTYRVIKLLGKGKGGYSYLVTNGENDFVLKKIHHEPCDYYTFGNKLSAELRDYERLQKTGIPMPELIDVDKQHEVILKEYIPGDTVAEHIKTGHFEERWLDCLREMCDKLYPAGLNIDYYPTNFVPCGDKLYYIDYECNDYMEKWDLEHWGIKYWACVKFRNYLEQDHDALFDFLVELNSCNKNNINWNWARFEWMYEHNDFDKSLIHSIGLWVCGERIVGAAIYDMYFGEAFCGALPEYSYLYPEIIDYTYTNMCDDSGLAIAVCDEDAEKKAALINAGFSKIEQHETVMKRSLNALLTASLSTGFTIMELDPTVQTYDFQWLLWQGFDHGNNKEEFEAQEKIIPQIRKNFDPHLSIAAVSGSGEKVAYCCLWYDDRTDYAYIEPLCTIPEYRGKGIARALLFEAMSRAEARGAGNAYVISDMEFYEKLGFEKYKRFSFYRKPQNERIGDDY